MKRALQRLALGVVGSATLLSACRPLAKDDLYGEYVAEYAFGSDHVVLNRDGTYSQTLSLKNGERVTNSGNWEFRPDSRASLQGAVWLANCLVVSDGFGRLSKGYQEPLSGSCTWPAGRAFLLIGELQLSGGDDYPHVKRR